MAAPLCWQLLAGRAPRRILCLEPITNVRTTTVVKRGCITACNAILFSKRSIAVSESGEGGFSAMHSNFGAATIPWTGGIRCVFQIR